VLLKKIIRKRVERIAKKMGFLIVAEWRLESYLLAKRLKKIISVYKIDCIFDVGANVGQYHDFLRDDVDYSGLIISFEPDPDNFKKLNELKKADDKWVIFDYALGNEKKSLDFHIMRSNDFNSFLEPDNSETCYFKDGNSIEKTIKIQTVRLDEIIIDIKKKYSFENMFLKLDTQGFDLKVFEGAFGCLDQIRGVQTEVSFVPIYKNMPSFDASLQLFKSKGFEVSGLYSLSEARFPYAVEFDCIFLPKPHNKEFEGGD